MGTEENQSLTDTSLMQAVAGWLMYSKASRLSEVNKPK